VNIIYLVPYVPNLIRVRPFNLIRVLSEQGDNVTVLTLWSNASERQDLRYLSTICKNVISDPLPKWRSLINCALAIPGKDPLQAAFCWQPALKKKLIALLNNAEGLPQYDVLHIEHLRGANYGLKIPKNSSIPVVWDSVDCISHLFRQAAQQTSQFSRRAVTSFELPRTEYYEGRLANLFDHTFVTSPIDRKAFLNLPNPPDPQRISVLPNGVDLEYFSPDSGISRDQKNLVISGKMSYHANVTMVLHLINNIMPLVWASMPEVTVTIVGKDPPQDIQLLTLDPRVRVTGYVEDIRPYLRRASAALAPTLYGAGIQNKVLEAMACGTPVISSKLAIQSLEVKNGHDLLAADETELFAKYVVEVLEKPDLQIALGSAARKFVEEKHSWGAVATNLKTKYASIKDKYHAL